MPFQFRKEAIEEELNSTFPSQGQGNPPLYYSLSETVVPTYSINNVAEGSTLGQNLQTAWDFSTGNAEANNSTVTIISNTGFWQIGINAMALGAVGNDATTVNITDGVSTKVIWKQTELVSASADTLVALNDTIVVFVRSGDSVNIATNASTMYINAWYRQIADLNGRLVNPLGYSAA